MDANKNRIQSTQLARIFIALDEVERKINNEILPAIAHLAPAEMAEVEQSLELAASTIQQFLNGAKLQMSIAPEQECNHPAHCSHPSHQRKN